jgi:hypothetical protein
MSVILSLTSEEQAALEAQAQCQGVSGDSLLRQALLHVIYSAPEPRLTVEELDTAFEEIADMIPESTSVLSDQPFTRESMYTREDEWNRNSR